METPRTDKAAFVANFSGTVYEVVDADFARKLEQENRDLLRVLYEAGQALACFVELHGMPESEQLKSVHNGIRIITGATKMLDKIKAGVEEEAMYEKKKAIKEVFKDGDWVFGIGPHKGCSQVFTGSSGDFQPFDYLNDYDPAHFRIATDKEIDEAKARVEGE